MVWQDFDGGCARNSGRAERAEAEADWTRSGNARSSNSSGLIWAAHLRLRAKWERRSLGLCENFSRISPYTFFNGFDVLTRLVKFAMFQHFC